jgi:release factor glutamine methyltransferase
LRKAEVWACDISAGALKVAKRNALAMGTEINFVQLDFLDKSVWGTLPSFDIIVSNPPYVPEKDKEHMSPNVLKHEPATALFINDNEPLLFYKAFAAFGNAHLNKGGSIYTEIHENLGEAATAVFHAAGYTAELRKDMQQKDRMLRAGLL